MKKFFKKIVISYLTLIAFLKIKIFFKGKIIGVAGCYGKSSAVNLIEELMKKKYKVRSTNYFGKGLNSKSGIPFAILGIIPEEYKIIDWIRYSILAFINFFKPFDYDYLILEMGVDEPGEMKYYTRFYKPDIGILLNSYITHSANFENLHLKTGRSYEDLISEENGNILERSKDAIFYNLEDPEVLKQVNRFAGQSKIGFSKAHTYHIRSFTPSLNGTKIVFTYANNTYSIHYKEPLLDEYQSTFDLLIKIAEYLNIEPKCLVHTIKNFKLPPGRCTLLRGINNSYILDSSYNSSLVPASSALKLLKDISQGRKLAVLGDMRELGELAEQEHKKLAHVAAKFTDLIITVGPLMKKYFVNEFELIKKENQIIYSFETTKEALEFIERNNYELIQTNDTILVKGSQNTLLLEIIIESLLLDKSEVSKLCRRDKLYEKKRKQLLS